MAPVARQEARMGHHHHGGPEPHLVNGASRLRLHSGASSQALDTPKEGSYRYQTHSSILTSKTAAPNDPVPVLELGSFTAAMG